MKTIASLAALTFVLVGCHKHVDQETITKEVVEEKLDTPTEMAAPEIEEVLDPKSP